MIAPTTRMGRVELTVSDVDRSLEYYERAIGLRVLERADARASLAADGTPLLSLVEEPGARPALGHTGLYHFALRVPTRPDLARFLAHAARERIPLVGLSDHFVSEAIYLSDPDAHGIEIYWDRPRELWEGQVARMTTLPLDVESLLGELDDPQNEPFGSLAAGTDMGHVHLRVADVPSSVEFYSGVLGFELMVRFAGQAAFLAAGGYHHHVGANTWESLGASPPPAGTARLRRATIVLPDEAERSALLERVRESGAAAEEHPEGPLVRDPSGNPLVLAVA